MSKQFTILVVEDEPHLRQVCEIVLRAEGYRVVEATNGMEGLAALSAHSIDLVLLDLYMPVMDGKEFLYNFDKEKFPDTKIVVYSNASEKDIKAQMKDMGADEVVLKSSLGPKELAALISRILATS